MKLKAIINSIKVKIIVVIVIIFLPIYFQNSTINVNAQSYISITIPEAYDMINNKTSYPNLIILDVRTRDEYESEHLCSAILIPLDELESRIDELESYKNTEIIVYCRSGSRSQQASTILVNNNFTKVYNMLTGIIGWAAEGYEVCPVATQEENGNKQPTISFLLIPSLLILFITTTILLISNKNRFKN